MFCLACFFLSFGFYTSFFFLKDLVFYFFFRMKSARQKPKKAINRRTDGFVPAYLHLEYQSLGLQQILLKPENHVVAMINELYITVQMVKAVYEGNQHQHKSVVDAVILALCHDSAWAVGVFPWLSLDLYRLRTTERIMDVSADEYRQVIANKQLILIPICYRCHLTLCAVYVADKKIHFYDSKPVYKTQEVWRKVVDFVQELYQAKFEVVIKEDIPTQQTNWTCGFYTVFYARSILYDLHMELLYPEDKQIIDDYTPLILGLITQNYDDRGDKDVCKKLPLTEIVEASTSALPETVDNIADSIDEDEEGAVVYEDASDTDSDKVEVIQVSEETVASVPKREDGYRRFLPTEEEARKLIEDDPNIMRFVGLKDGKHHTYNTDGSWQQMLSFMEILRYLEKYPGIPEQCQSTMLALQIIQEEIGRNPELFNSWFYFEKPVGADCSTEYFYWGNLRNRVFVIRWMKELHGIHYKNEEGLKRSKEVKRRKKENNPDFKAMRKQKYRENRRQKRRAEAAAKRAAKASKAANPQVDHC